MLTVAAFKEWTLKGLYIAIGFAVCNMLAGVIPSLVTWGLSQLKS